MPGSIIPRMHSLLTVSLSVTLGITLFAAACAHQKAPPLHEQATEMSAANMIHKDNPFFAPSSLPLHAPRFDLIRTAHYQPAMLAGMEQQRKEIDRIATNADPVTFANTIEAMELSGQLLLRVSKVFAAMTQANTDDELQQIEGELAPKLAAHRDAIYLDGKLFARIDTLHQQKGKLALDAEQSMLLARYHRDFVRAGAQLPAFAQEQLRALNQELSSLSTDFRKVLLSATKDGAVVVLDKAQLAGLAAGEIEAAFAAAKERKIDGKWVLTLQNTTQQPPLASLVDRSLRQRLLAASTSRGATDGADDTRVIVMKIAKLRAKQALLLGFHDYASYALDDQMAKTPAAAISLLTDMVPAAVAKARGEVAKMQAIVDQGKPSFPLAACDWQFYAEQVRKAEYDLDEAAIKPYFLLDRVLSDGVFFAAHELYGLSFIERKDLPVYHPDVRLFEVLEKDRVIALVYTDYYKRDNKSGGAWMDSFVDQASLLGTLPVVFNVCNFQRPIAGQPALLSFDDVTTMFHEFGHALHGLLSEVRYPLLSGTAVPRDYVEFPSQFNEHWAMEPRVFANYAKHWQTGAPMPAETVAKIQKSKTFDQGYATTEYLAAALLDLAWHSVAVADAPVDVHAFEAAKLRDFGLALSEVPPRYRSTYFAHIWGGGYAASYYAYMWAEVLDHDAYDWFVEHGGMTRENGKRYRDMVLSRGGTIECGAMYRAFRGRDPKVEPLLRERGLR